MAFMSVATFDEGLTSFAALNKFLLQARILRFMFAHIV